MTTLKQAILRIGFDRLRIMALSLSLRDTFPMGRIGPMDYEAFWRSSLYRTLLAKSLAHTLSTCNPEEAFVAGLTLEIGLLVFFDLFVKDKHENGSLDLYPLESLLSWKKVRYGADHRQIGKAALRYWRFPDSISVCQRFYGRKVRKKGTPTLPMVCEAARELSALMCHETTELQATFEVIEESFGLDREVINDILAITLEQVESIAESLKVAVSSDRDIIELIEKANRALSKLAEQMATRGDLAARSDLPSFQDLDEENKRDTIIAHTLQAVVHEIRNPLMAVGGFAKRLARTVDSNTEVGEYVRVILEKAERLEQALFEMTRHGAPKE